MNLPTQTASSPVTDGLHVTQPISTEQLCQQARLLAQNQTLDPLVRRRDGRALIRRFRANSARLRYLNRELRRAVQAGEYVPTEADWILDNFYVIEEQLQEIDNDLPPTYLDQLPRITGGEPRVYVLAHEAVTRLDSALDEDSLSQFLTSYQQVQTLSIGEVWAFPIMLRITLVERLRRLADQLWLMQKSYQYASKVVANFRRTNRLDIDSSKLMQSASWIAMQAEQIPDIDTSRLRELLHSRLTDVGWKLSDLERLNHQSSARSQISFANTITSMRLMSMLEWTVFFEDHCAAEKTLRQDPSGVYAECSPTTRNQYRTAVETLAKRTAYNDQQVAAAAIELCKSHLKSNSNDAALESHVGYWLLDEGLGQLENKLRFEPAFLQKIVRGLRAKPYFSYLSVVGGIWIVSMIVLGMLLLSSDPPLIAQILIMACCGTAISELAIQIGNWLFTLILPPSLLPKLELEQGIPERHPTIAVVPCLFGSAAEVDMMLRRLENHYLSNGVPGLRFALLTDFGDADTETAKNDQSILQIAADRLQMLNDKYGINGKGPFYIFHRSRRFNPQEGKWMGWERKRGKLMEFGKWLMGIDNVDYLLASGDLDSLSPFRDPNNEPFVITLDADTQLPHGAALKLIGTLAHPLVRPVWNAPDRCVDRGYVVLQPRVSIDLQSRMLSKFAALHSTGAGVSPYVTASSDLYQDLFKEGSFTGKGIYDLRVFEHALQGAFPENAILSHDLIEGAHTRVAMTSDIEVFDGYPSRYDGDAKRIHRWVRGDWQILPWLFPRVPSEKGSRANSINALSKWKIFDNIRRSLVSPAIVMFLGLALYFLGPQTIWAVLAVLAIFFVPPVLHAIYAMFCRSRQIHFYDHARAVIADFNHNIVLALSDLTFTAHKAQQMVDAIIRTIYRMLVSHRHMLQWQTALAVEFQNKGSLSSMLAYLWASPAIAIVLAVIADQSKTWVASPLIVLWLVAPLVAYVLSKRKVVQSGSENEFDVSYLRRITRRTWTFFESYATKEYHFLPPDNVQEIPDGRIAARISPTNEGLFLLSAMAARDCGFISVTSLCRIWKASWTSWRKLETYKGHYYNWYDTTNLLALNPRYVSTVDSGNLAACLLAWEVCLAELADQPIFHPSILIGFGDTVDCLIEDLRKALYGTGEQNKDCEPLLGELLFNAEAARRELDALVDTHLPEGLESKNVVDLSLDKWAEILARLRQQLIAPIDNSAVSSASDWLNRKFVVLRSTLEGFEDDLHLLQGAQEQLKSFPLRTISLSKLSLILDSDSYRNENTHNQVEVILSDLKALQVDAEETFKNMNFRFLVNSKRKLFRIGYNVETERFDNSHYDMLASESRLGSYIAIGKGDVPAAHWFRLGRSSTYAAGSICLVSWGGTMFEYLMPSLLQKHFEKSLLTETALATINRQQEYMRSRNIPWGISESAYSTMNSGGDYQYQSFGVPGLGLKRGLARDLVVAPYATLLSLDLRTQDAIDNLRRLEAVGAFGPWGFYDAVDYTASRVPSKNSPIVVRNYYTHHHGMSILALINCLFKGVMQDRFSRHSIARSCELLLQEKYPTAIPRLEDLTQSWDEVTPSTIDDSLVVRRIERFDTIRPRTILLGNGTYSMMLTHTGEGYSRWKNTMISRWRYRSQSGGNGAFVYLRDLDTQERWSPSYQPLMQQCDEASVSFAIDKAEYRTRQNNIETLLEATVSPETDAEVRKLRITNHSSELRRIEITSYMELAIASQSADMAHPAFQKLFIETSKHANRSALVAHRRSRDGAAHDLWAGQVVSHDAKSRLEFSYETSRESFIGRLNDLHNPAAFSQENLGNTVGAVLDPIFSFRCVIELVPEQSVNIAFATIAADSASQLERLLELCSDFRSIQRAFDLCWVYHQAELKGRHINAKQSHLYQRLASYLLYPSTALHGGTEALLKNSLSQEGWWRYGISGDLPILTLVVSSVEEKSVVADLLKGQGYLQTMGLDFDILVIDENAGSYLNEVREMLDDLKSRVSTPAGSVGKVVVIPATSLSSQERTLLEATSTMFLRASEGSLASHLARATAFEKSQTMRYMGLPYRNAEYQTHYYQPQPISNDDTPISGLSMPTSSRSDVLDNGWGNVIRNAPGYEVDRSNTQPTPAPWSMILSNPNFGTLLTESGGGYTWFGNSRQYKLTQWSNDPVCDPASEQLWVRDEDTYEVFQAFRDTERVRYEPGAVTAECVLHDISCRLHIWVDPSKPIKFVQFKLSNKTDRHRTLSATYFADIVLGDHIEHTHNTLCGGILKDKSAVWARNPYHSDYPNATLVLLSNQLDSTLSANRIAFELRGSSTALPLAMCIEKLDESEGMGGECGAAVRSVVRLEPRGSVCVVFALAVVDELVEIDHIQQQLQDIAESDQPLNQCLSHWRGATQPFVVETPNIAFNRLVNDWLMYQTIACRVYARTAYYQCGGAFGFRDQLQDCMAAVYADPSLARSQLLKSASRQYVAGDVQHWWHEPSGRGTRTRFSDDRLFLPYTALHYARITGDDSIWDEEVHFIDSAALQESEQERYELPKVSGKSSTFFDHCVRAIDASLKFGSHGLPLIGCGDWNDGMNRIGQQGKGESIWVAWFLLSVLDSFTASHKTRLASDKYASYLQTTKRLRVAIDEHAWDGDWYLRAFFDDGTPLGSHRNQACRIDSLTQSWAVFVNPMNPRTKHAFVEAINQLVDHDAKLIRLFAPSFDRYEPDPGYINAYLPGIRENGGQYTHAAIWLAQAAAMLGENDLAMQLFDYLNPLLRSNTPSTASKYKLEPYVMAADIYYNPQHIGRGGWSWYTGSAAWMYRLAIETILGVQLRGKSISFHPRVPDSWSNFAIKVNLQNKQFLVELTRHAAGESPSPQPLPEYRAGQVIELQSIEDGQTIRIKF